MLSGPIEEMNGPLSLGMLLLLSPMGRLDSGIMVPPIGGRVNMLAPLASLCSCSLSTFGKTGGLEPLRSYDSLSNRTALFTELAVYEAGSGSF